MKTYFFTFCVLFSLGLGISFYFKEEIGKNIYKVGAAQKVSADNLMEDEKKGNPAARNPSSLATKHRVIEEKNSFYKNNLYWNKMKQDPSVERLYLKSLNIFKESKNAEDFAIWIASSLIFDSSLEYGEIITTAMENINLNSEENFALLGKTLSTLKEEDAFLRGMGLNMANQFHVNKSEKIKLFGQESSRKLMLNEKGDLSDDSLNMTTAIIFLKENSNENTPIETIYQKALRENTDPKIQKKISERFSTYFPQLK